MMGQTLHLDDRGRVTIPKEIRRFLPDEFVAIAHPDGVTLYPVPQHVESEGPGDDRSVEEIAMTEVEEKLRRTGQRP